MRGAGSILVVDDDAGMGEMLVRALGKKSFQVEHVTHGDDALRLLGEGTEVDTVVTDLNMKGIDGISLCKRIVEMVPDVPVVVITAFGSLETAIQAIRAGAYDFITKPFDVETLLRTLDAIQGR